MEAALLKQSNITHIYELQYNNYVPVYSGQIEAQYIDRKSVHKNDKDDIAKDLASGYMKMLTEMVNK